MSQEREVDDQTSVRIAERAEEFAWCRGRIVSSEHGHAWQRIERSIVPFRVDDAQAVAVQNLPFAMVPS